MQRNSIETQLLSEETEDLCNSDSTDFDLNSP